MAKLAPSDLVQVLSKLPKQQFSTDVLVGYETSDDAGVFRLNDNLAIVQTVDFFSPVVDEPKIYGQIAAINSLNDIYAMGGTPVSALSIVCFPQKGDWKILEEILRGGQNTLNEDNVVVLGGHSIDDQEIKFGYAITGVINPNKIIKNSGAKDGDVLLLTKPIGTGVISTAIKFDKAKENVQKASIETMKKSSRYASEIMVEVGANGCTDVTGFGLLGHAFEMAKASGVTLEIDSEKVPLLPEVLDLIEQKMLTRGDKNNRTYVGQTIRFNESVTTQMQSALFDPQTAGGLLISLSADKADYFLKKVENSNIIGTVRKYNGLFLEVN